MPLPWRNSALPKAFYYLGETRLLGILFSCFLIIGNVYSGIYLKIDVVDFRKIFIA